MRILLTGGTGFLGSAFIRATMERFSFVTVGRRPAHPEIPHVEADLGTADGIESLLRPGRISGQFDAFAHLAVSPFHREFPERALDQFNVNTASVAALLDLARRHGARTFVLGSTGTVYHPFRNPPFHEDEACDPRSYMGYTKHAAENACQQYARYFNIFIPRFFTPYGPGQQERLISSLIARISAGQPVQLPEEGGGLITAPVFLDDAVRVLQGAITEGWPGIMNVGGPECLDLAQMARIIGQVAGRPPVFQRSQAASGAELRPALDRLAQRIPLSTMTTFEQGIRRTIAGSPPEPAA